MKYRQLGATGLTVSSLSLGSWALGGSWGGDVEDGIQAVRRAVDLGVNFFDSAHSYGSGKAEVGLGEGLRDVLREHRQDLIIATKGGIRRVGDGVGTPVRDSDPAWLRETLELSLVNLGTDYVDLYHIHWPDPTVPFEETSEVMRGFVAEGLVRFVGVSNFSIEEMESFQRGGRIDVAQVPYNLLTREANNALIPFFRKHEVGVTGWSALLHGVLTGTLSPAQVFAPGDFRATDSRFQGPKFAAALEALEPLKDHAADKGCTVAQLAIAWVIAQGVVPIIGAQCPAHVEASARAVELVLDGADLERLQAIADGAPPFQVADGADIGVLVRTQERGELNDQ